MNQNYNNLPSDFAHPGGFVEDVMNYINDTAVCPQPLFALGAALTLAGTLYGRKVQSEDGQRTNIFVMTVGYTSSGKDHALKSIARILDSCAASDLRLGQVTSDSAIEWALKRQPRACFMIDEAGHYFAGVSDPSAKGSPQHAIKPALLELWSCANARWKGKQRVPRDGKTELPPLEVDCPHLCLYATTQPQILFESMSRNDLRDGWLSRNLFFISDTRPKPTFQPLREVPNAIRAVVYAYKDTPTLNSNFTPPITIPTTDEAQRVFADFGEEVYKKMLFADKTGDETNYLYGKAVENARRIALILAVSRAKGPTSATAFAARIEERDATYATTLVMYLIEEMIRIVRDNLYDSPDEKAMKRIKKVIAMAGAEGISRNELTRKTQNIRRTFREEYIADLIESREIVIINDDQRGTHYKYNIEL